MTARRLSNSTGLPRCQPVSTLDKGVDVNGKDNNGQTALHGAASWGWNGLVKTLVTRKADLMVKDGRGRTAADIVKGAPGSSGRTTSEPHPETENLLRNLMASAPQAQAGESRSSLSP